MIPSNLDWFAQLSAKYAPSPTVAKTLGNALLAQFSSKNVRVQTNRVFRRHSNDLQSILQWLTSAKLEATIRAKSSSATTAAYVATVCAIRSILNGSLPSVAWNMGKQRGVDTSLSKTLEGVALAEYLVSLRDEQLPENLFSTIENLSEHELLVAYALGVRSCTRNSVFSRTRALEVAAELFDIHVDSIRKYSDLEPASPRSQAVVALFGLSRLGMLTEAERFFDVSDLILSAATPSGPVTI